MALESSDLNDGQILQQTKQVEDARGSIQFSIVLPSGRTLKSEFMSRDNARAGMRKWLDVVKEQAIADSNAERLERAAKARRGKMDIERKPGDDKPLFRAGGARVDDSPQQERKPDYADQTVDYPTYFDPSVNSPKQDDQSRSPEQERTKEALERVLEHAKQLDTDTELYPLEFAKKQLKRYSDRVEALRAAEKAFRQWSIIVNALEESDDV